MCMHLRALTMDPPAEANFVPKVHYGMFENTARAAALGLASTVAGGFRNFCAHLSERPRRDLAFRAGTWAVQGAETHAPRTQLRRLGEDEHSITGGSHK